MEIVEFGSVYFNGGPVSVGAKRREGEEVSIGDTAPQEGIPFVKWNGIFVADKCVCTNVSWTGLDKLGFIFGYPIMIDGALYLCRSLKAGAKMNVPNEWDALLNDFGTDNGLWHWERQYFWGQEKHWKYENSRVIRGFNGARHWSDTLASFHNLEIGFRPVLEPLPPTETVSKDLIGNNLTLYSGGRSIAGRLVGYDDYDLELSVSGFLPEGCPWIRRTGNAVFIDREAIVYIYKEKK